MGLLKLRRLLVVLILGLLIGVTTAGGGSGKCGFPAVYNFGDSNSDTGGISAAFNAIQPPNGETFFRRPSGRACDGRLIVDFIAEKLKLPYLSAYLDSLGTNFRHGANFATGGSSICPGGYSPFHLGIQVSQFIQFKSRITDLFNRLHSNNKTSIPIKRIARPQEFSKALYTFDIGQNDLAYGYQHSSEEQVRASIPDILNTFSEAVQQLYKEGARYFWVHNTGPIGCLPYSILYNKSPDNRDSNGCVESQNEVSREFNRQLKSRLLKLGKKLPLARIIHIDMYSAKYLLITEAKTQGFVKNPVKFCCGSYYGYHIDCGKREVVNGTVYGNPCKDPSRHISWDGIHYSEAANLWIANHILNGSFSDPPLPIDKACRAPSYA
ncbi:GDSL esterase/lipase At3g27950-like isoform X1 [Cucurbita moschata]|uniref:GDSL esterase/lipase At3g27950-like isoform X1 n=1 Tax=Cucurbita moschata TaxID=3662 RepID=A0A6J1FK92_CUCMO|nr:GDSL esterase/lipase At3g27950-like isoform X1 [Cucurbita moschata]